MAHTLLSNGYLWMTLTIALKFYPASQVPRDELEETLAEHPAAADLPLGWIRPVEFKVRLASQFKGRSRSDNEFLAQHQRVTFEHRSADYQKKLINAYGH